MLDRRPSRPRLLAAIALVAAAAVPASAGATPNFPPEMQTHLKLSYQPPCSVCHLNGVTNVTTVTTPFGMSMRGAGLLPNDIQSLDDALDKLEANGTDSDGDGTPDIEEIKMGKDPNTTGGSLAAGPVYGCAAQAPGADGGAETPTSAVISAGSRTPWFASAFTAMVLAFAMRRRRR